MVGVEGRVEVYNLMGIQVAEATAIEGKAVSDLAGRSGVYIVRADHQAYKLIIE